MDYKTVIGLEIHVELLTDSKIFCGCSTAFGGEANTYCCPICLGLPGTLPVINKKVVEFAVKTGFALNCRIAEVTRMDRKNYFYPDLPKAYQITQYEMPICTEGYLELEKAGGETKRIRIRRIHMEEDTGKSVHSENNVSLVDYNRSGVPLIEIVTEPDIHSSEEAYQFLEKLKAILQYIEVSDCKMEQGSLRCDININLQSKDGRLASNIVELKNLNSFKAIVKAIEFEIKRHKFLLEQGKNTEKETRRWDETKEETCTMRNKEHVEDYRYFPEPDLAPIQIERSWIEYLQNHMPELPADKKKRFIEVFDLPSYDADVLTSSKAMAAFFEEVVKEVQNPKMVSNWIMTELWRRLKERSMELEDISLTAQDFIKFLKLIQKGVLSNNIGKKVLKEMVETGNDPENIVRKNGWMQISDEKIIREWVEKVIRENQESVTDYQNGKEKALDFLMGQAMKVSKGKANPQMVNQIIRRMLKEPQGE